MRLVSLSRHLGHDHSRRGWDAWRGGLVTGLGATGLTWTHDSQPTPGAAAAGGQRPARDGRRHGGVGGRAGDPDHPAGADSRRRAMVDLDLRRGTGHGAVRAVVRAPAEAGPRPCCRVPEAGREYPVARLWSGWLRTCWVIQGLEDGLVHGDAGQVHEVVAKLVDHRRNLL